MAILRNLEHEQPYLVLEIEELRCTVDTAKPDKTAQIPTMKVVAAQSEMLQAIPQILCLSGGSFFLTVSVGAPSLVSHASAFQDLRVLLLGLPQPSDWSTIVSEIAFAGFPRMS